MKSGEYKTYSILNFNLHKMTFNSYFTHHCLPFIFNRQDMITAFYTNILPYCDRLQDFLMTMWQNAIKAASNEPDIELPCDIESFDITLYGTLESGVICIAIPNCQESRDCTAIAFPTTLQQAGYYTCEYGINPLNNSDNFYLGQWLYLDENGFHHQNWGIVEQGNYATFATMVYDIAYNK